MISGRILLSGMSFAGTLVGLIGAAAACQCAISLSSLQAITSTPIVFSGKVMDVQKDFLIAPGGSLGVFATIDVTDW